MISKAASMKSVLLLSALAALGMVSAPLSAQQQAQNDGTARSKVKPARLIEFTGDREFLKESSRLRVWRGEVGYTLAVDAAGMPTGCELTEKFRMNYINDKLCEVLLKHHSFEPAIDASGTAIQSRYEGRLNYMEIREKD
ncbi:MAG: hypothetical protein EAY70_10730 [Sphingomonadales bacterium]|nr:MAG: hypothetical protein EAY70_10730 [Sphingomonadales bacterium]